MDTSKIPSDRRDSVIAEQQKRREKNNISKNNVRLIKSNINKTLEILKKQGIGVSIIHWRNVQIPVNGVDFVVIEMPFFQVKEKGMQGLILPNGGKTSVRLFIDGRSVQGEAVCSEKESFCRHAGLIFALERAIYKAQSLNLI